MRHHISGIHYGGRHSRASDLPARIFPLGPQLVRASLSTNFTGALICDGFGMHETLEVLEFCFENTSGTILGPMQVRGGFKTLPIQLM